jgi:hypothetical protein
LCKGELLILARRYHAARECLALALSHPARRGAWTDAVHRALAQLEAPAPATGERHAHPASGGVRDAGRSEKKVVRNG